MKIPKELIREFVKEEKFTSTSQIMDAMKELFSSALEEVLQCEMDEQLGFNKHVRTSDRTVLETQSDFLNRLFDLCSTLVRKLSSYLLYFPFGFPYILDTVFLCSIFYPLGFGKPLVSQRYPTFVK